MPSPLNILMLEDNAADAEIVRRLLKKEIGDFDFKLVMNKSGFLAALEQYTPDLILADNALPQFNATEALQIIQDKSLRIPFILVTGTVSEEFAANIIKLGADDYILKDRLARLPGAIEAAMKHYRSELQNNEATLRLIQSEENLKAIFDNSSEGFILLDENGIVKAFNKRARESILVNVAEEITIGSNILKYILEDRKENFLLIKEKILQGETIQFDRLYTRQNGNVAWINFTFNPVKKVNNINGMCITGRDITDKKIAEQQKEFDRNNLYALINNTHDLMWSVSSDLKLITSNKAFDDIILWSSGEPLPKGSNILRDIFDPEQLERCKKYYERAFTGESFTVVEHNHTPVEFWSEISFYPIYEERLVIGTACFSRDITQKIKAEREVEKNLQEKNVLASRMSTIINTLPANIALLDEKATIVDVNDAWRNFASSNGYAHDNFAVGVNYLAVSNAATGNDERDGKIVSKGIQDVLENKMNEFVFEYSCHSPEIKRWFRMVVTPLKEKEIAGAVIMHVDISELRRLEQERIENKVLEQRTITRAMLQAQEQERNQLGRELHDNISQLLAAIKMKLGFCIDYYETGISIVKECVVHVEEAIMEARNLSHRLVIPRFAESSFLYALEELISNYDNDLRSVTLEADEQTDDLLPTSIKETLYRIAQEQLNNMEKYSKASEVFVVINVDDHLISFLVTDNGMGFDTREKRKGIGITNILNRAESYNGTAKIISSPGMGCKLFVEIPLKEFNAKLRL